ncbi:uncharacterized protein LOC18448667 isoform X1 [Amborella trichopoda]|uniref:uncharacterized protein LOC18448667 isoform X1 n=1 Tax=Amborella trichopoda TaxID=13333 RepID=UPI0005D30A34|nr:uncharacterized protein LOC18448667 isoform X1 [Amborella trichopoda]|eukprot:XP_011628712.1 uncharacterized protein LOC18448667 isoform X1 [Amborella trichopoda]
MLGLFLDATMLTVCSAAPGSSQYQINWYGGPRTFAPWKKTVVYKCILEEGFPYGVRSRTHTLTDLLKTHAVRFECDHVLVRSEPSASVNCTNTLLKDAMNSDLSDYLHEFTFKQAYNWPQPPYDSYSLRAVDESYPVDDVPAYVEDTTISEPVESLSSNGVENDIENNLNVQDGVGEPSMSSSMESQYNYPNGNELPDSLPLPSQNGIEVYSESNASESLPIENAEQYTSKIQESMDSSVDRATGAMKNTYSHITSTIEDSIKNTMKTVEHAINDIISSADDTGRLVKGRFVDFTGDVKEGASKAADMAIIFLRQGVVAVENSLANAASFVVYSYGSAKNLLPLETQNAVNSSEEKVQEIFSPLGPVFQQVQLAIEGLEKSLGLDPNDPILHFVLFLGSSATVGISYWIFKYGGYSGDLSPKLALEMLVKEDSAVLIDIRSEDEKERDGVPDLRRGVRFRYASVNIPKVDDTLMKVLKNGKEINYVLVAAVIRNLKLVNDSSKVIVLDANGSHSKSVARSLRRLGVKRPYLVQGGFISWVKDGFRVKDLKTVTALTILIEETEEIIEDIKPTPGKIIASSAALIAAIYALVEWEKTLQYIGIFGLGQTLYKRISSYEDSEDLKEDLRLLLTPVRTGGKAFAWAVGQLKPTKMKLPMSPSTTAVQTRVLQAAAKHSSPVEQSTPPSTENLDPKEA